MWPAVSVGCGLAAVGAWVMRARVSVLEHRLASLLPDGRRAASPGLFPRVLTMLTRLLGRLLGGGEQVRVRLERAGEKPDLDAFRTSQALWGMAGFAAACGVVLVSSMGSGTSPASASALILAATTCGVLARDQRLTRQAHARQARMVMEFPAVADMLALAVAAGQGPLGALEQVTRLCRGPLSDELRTALDEARAGVPLASGLEGVARRTSALGIARFVEGVIVALERGTPLADVLRAQAQDAREAARAELVETAGKKEVLMMAPVVFLVLPVTVLFAVFPGLSALDLSL